MKLSKIALFFYVCTLFACENPFSTRTPEEPSQNSSTFISPVTPDIVFLNIQIAMSERNVENYVRSFVDSTRSDKRFEFLADEAVAATQPGTFLNWDLEDERRYLTQMFQATPVDSIIRLTFSLENSSEDAATATYTQNYNLLVDHSRQTQGLGNEIVGQARFFLERDETGNWAISSWSDFNTTEEASSWSELKAFFQ